jgi:hypothetical protein
MTAIRICPETIKLVKRALQLRLPGFKSAHLTEALAAGLGYQKHASLVADYRDPPRYQILYLTDFAHRLKKLSGLEVPEIEPGFYDTIEETGIDGVQSVGCETPMFSNPEAATVILWRRIAVAGLNRVIDADQFHIHPGHNPWDRNENLRSVGMRTDIQGIPADCYITAAGHGEVHLRVVLWPKLGVEDPAKVLIISGKDAEICGRVVVDAWVQCGPSVYLAIPELHADPALIQELLRTTALERPKGFGPNVLYDDAIEFDERIAKQSGLESRQH